MSFAWFTDTLTLRLLLENTSSAFGHINSFLFYTVCRNVPYWFQTSKHSSQKCFLTFPDLSGCCDGSPVQSAALFWNCKALYSWQHPWNIRPYERRSATVVSVRMTKAFHSEIYLICGLGRYQVVITVQPRVVQLMSFMAWAQDSHSK